MAMEMSSTSPVEMSSAISPVDDIADDAPITRLPSSGTDADSRTLFQTAGKPRLFRLPPVPHYVSCAIFSALGGFLWGFDTGSIGPITLMPQFRDQFSPITSTVQGLIVSSILLTASISSLVAGPLADKFSRTRIIALGAAIFSAGSAIACSGTSLPQLFIGRCIAGAGEGLFASVITVYTCEIAPTVSRGRLACTFQLFNVIGLASGYFVCYGTVRVPSSFAWRFPLAMQSFVSAVLALGMPLLPHSPRWLMEVGRHAEVDATWAKLGVSQTEAEKEGEMMQREQRVQVRGPWYEQAQQLWKKDVRGRTILCAFLMGMQQLSGIDSVLYYAPVLFGQAGLNGSTASFLASGVSGLLNVAFTIPVQIYADSWGRRMLMISGGLVIAGTMLLMGTIYATAAHNTEAGRWTVIVLIYIFVIAFVTSWAVACRTVCSEIQPMKTRAAALSLGQCVSWAVNWIIAFSTPLFLARSGSGPYFLFGGCSLTTVLVCAAFQPETKGMTLEDIDKSFSVSPWRTAWDRYRRDPSTSTAADDLELTRVRPREARENEISD